MEHLQSLDLHKFHSRHTARAGRKPSKYIFLLFTMILEIYAVLMAISILFILIGYHYDSLLIKTVGFLLLATINIVNVTQGWQYKSGSVSEVCEPIINNYNDVYVYGNNYTDYHWDYDYSIMPNEDVVRLFHVKRYNNWTTFCYNSTTINNVYTQYSNNIFNLSRMFSLILLVLGLYGAYYFNYEEYANRRGEK